jgi:putative ABC transport system ATP-binding protein
VTKVFGSGESRSFALRGVDVDINDGQMTLMVGPSGCGKTTLISIIAGLLNPSEGDVSVLGEDLNTLQGRRLVEFRGQNLGFVFQQYNLLPALNAIENAAIPLIALGNKRRDALERAGEMLEAVGLGAKKNALPSQLSGGQQQRVAIARALGHQPRLLVCDEPTAALDAESGQVVMELLRKVAVMPGRAVIVVTHDNRVYKYGETIVHMSDGRVTEIESQVGLEEELER